MLNALLIALALAGLAFIDHRRRAMEGERNRRWDELRLEQRWSVGEARSEATRAARNP